MGRRDRVCPVCHYIGDRRLCNCATRERRVIEALIELRNIVRSLHAGSSVLDASLAKLAEEYDATHPQLEELGAGLRQELP